jgi:hypothetical protein
LNLFLKKNVPPVDKVGLLKASTNADTLFLQNITYAGSKDWGAVIDLTMIHSNGRVEITYQASLLGKWFNGVFIGYYDTPAGIALTDSKGLMISNKLISKGEVVSYEYQMTPNSFITSVSNQ